VTDALALNETMFFRDRTPFRQFAEVVLLAWPGSRDTLRVWSAACSDGQEPYSLAMLMEELRPQHPGLQLDLCASDISERLLEKARTGVYSKFEVQRGLPIARLVQHFEPVDDAWRIKPALRQAVRWRTFNLLDDPRPLGRFDVVFCCNVLDGMDATTRARVLDQIASVTAPDGFLLLGAREPAPAGFQPVPDQPGLYTRDPGFRRAA
jgi:chemotaxis protein methyltransferase CheR